MELGEEENVGVATFLPPAFGLGRQIPDRFRPAAAKSKGLVPECLQVCSDIADATPILFQPSLVHLYEQGRVSAAQYLGSTDQDPVFGTLHVDLDQGYHWPAALADQGVECSRPHRDPARGQRVIARMIWIHSKREF